MYHIGDKTKKEYILQQLQKRGYNPKFDKYTKDDLINDVMDRIKRNAWIRN